MLHVKNCSRTQASRLCPAPAPYSASFSRQSVHSDTTPTNSASDRHASPTLIPWLQSPVSVPVVLHFRTQTSSRCSCLLRRKPERQAHALRPAASTSRHEPSPAFPLRPVTLGFSLQPVFHSDTEPSKTSSCQLSTPTRHPRDQSPANSPLRH